ncbi:hypothetical protein D9M68_789180 [compost metagenome]
MASWQFQGSCYPTTLAANQAAASASSGVVSSGSVVVATAVTESSISFESTDLTTGAVVSRTVALDPQPCNLLDAADAEVLGWYLIGAFASVYAIRWLGTVLYNSLHLEARNDA